MTWNPGGMTMQTEVTRREEIDQWLAGLTDNGPWQTMSAAQQRKVFGFPLLGKKQFRRRGHTVVVKCSVCFGTDWNIYTFTSGELADLAEKREMPRW